MTDTAVDDEIERCDACEQVLTRYGFLQKDVLYSYRFSADQLCSGIG